MTHHARATLIPLAALALLAAPAWSAGGRGADARGADRRAALTHEEAMLPVGAVLEGSVETTAGAVIFPSAPGGRLQVRGCDYCARSVIETSAETTYNVAGQLLPLADMASFCTRNPGRSLTLHYRLRDGIATRVEVSGG